MWHNSGPTWTGRLPEWLQWLIWLPLSLVPGALCLGLAVLADRFAFGLGALAMVGLGIGQTICSIVEIAPRFKLQLLGALGSVLILSVAWSIRSRGWPWLYTLSEALIVVLIYAGTAFWAKWRRHNT